MRLLFVWVILPCLLFLAAADIDREEEKLPTKCHVCKHLVQEIQDELTRSARSKEVFRTGQIFQEQRKEINYQKSEVRLNEALENACSNVLDYKVHKDKIKALRYEKKESVTFNTLKGLKNRGVKVDLGFPYEMWDSPDAEVTRLKSRCELMVETYEDELIEWYWNHQTKNLTHWLCMERVLDPEEKECFNETEPEKKDKGDSEKEDARDGKGKDQDNKHPKKKETEKKKKKKEKSSKRKSKGKNKSSSKKEGSSPDREGDSENIQRLIKKQAMEQEKRTKKNKFGGIVDEGKRREWQQRLRDIHDVDRLRRELRKIQMQEMTKYHDTSREPWEDDLDTRVPEDVRREIRRRQLDQMNIPEVLRRELIMRVLDADEDFDDPQFRNLQELRHRYMDEAEEIHNPEELKKRIDDLDALSEIMAGSLDNRRRRRRPAGLRDEL